MSDATPHGISTPIVHIRGLSVTHRRWGRVVHAIDGIDLELERGTWTLLVGPNGSGKTTLLRTLAGVQSPDAGAVYIDGRPLAADRRGRRGQVYLVRQDPRHGTASMLTLFENLLAADPAARGVGRRQLAERYRAQLAPIGLADQLDQVVGTLSGGQRQLLGLLIARAQPAPVILLDEPFAALDPQRVEDALTVLRALHAAGRTLVQVSHDPQHIATLGDRVVALDGGRLNPAGAARRSPAPRR